MTRKATKDGGRALRVRVRAKGLKASSTRWLERQLNDPYVAEAKRKGYRSRAAFKLAELDDKFRILKKSAIVLDLGAAPGGWSQVARQRIGPGGRVVGVDILDTEPIEGVDLLTLDMLSAEAPAAIRAALGGTADVVLSDMAAPTTGHKRTDQMRTAVLFEVGARDRARRARAGRRFRRQSVPGRRVVRSAPETEAGVPRREAPQAAGVARRIRWSCIWSR